MKTLIPFPSFGRKVPAPKIDSFGGLQQELKEDVDRIMAGFGSQQPDWDPPAARGLDIRETASGMEIEGEFPGFDERDIKIAVSGNVLTIRAEKKASEKKSNGKGQITERCFSSLSQRVTLPFEPNANKLASSFAHGVLHVSIPKAC